MHRSHPYSTVASQPSCAKWPLLLTFLWTHIILKNACLMQPLRLPHHVCLFCWFIIINYVQDNMKQLQLFDFYSKCIMGSICSISVAACFCCLELKDKISVALVAAICSVWRHKGEVTVLGFFQTIKGIRTVVTAGIVPACVLFTMIV